MTSNTDTVLTQHYTPFDYNPPLLFAKICCGGISMPPSPIHGKYNKGRTLRLQPTRARLEPTVPPYIESKYLLASNTLSKGYNYTPRCNLKDLRKYTGQRKRWISILSWYPLMAWCTYPRNETLVHQQLSLHQPHHHHPSQCPLKQFFCFRDVTCSIYYV